jgi:hypothetical protein
MFLQNLHKLLSYILDMLYSMSWLVTTRNIAQSYWRDLLIKIILWNWQICLEDFCSFKYNYFWAQLLATVLLYQNAFLGEFIMILSLLEILFPHLCLFFIINMCSMFHKGYRCVPWFVGLVLDQSMCRRKLGFNYVVFILICIIPLYAN